MSLPNNSYVLVNAEEYKILVENCLLKSILENIEPQINGVSENNELRLRIAELEIENMKLKQIIEQLELI